MRRIRLLSAFVFPALLMGLSLIAPTPQAPPPPDLPHPDGVFSQAYMEAHRFLLQALSSEDTDQKRALLLKAIAQFTEALQESPDNAGSIYIGRGVAYSQLGQYDQAIADYNAALRITPWSFEALWK